jgi:alpha-ketoglutarate-dependent taurine dioxygenase
MSNLGKPRLRVESARRRAVQTAADLVTVGPLNEGSSLPLLIHASLPHLKLHYWIENNLGLVEEFLQKSGAILFRNFDVAAEEDFKAFTQSLRLELMHYMEGATPRKPLGNDIYTSTEFPAEHAIALHNENSYVMTWPMQICFCCVIAPQDRGETPIADVRRVLQRIHPEILITFEEKGYMLVRNFNDHLSLPWQSSFRVSTREELENYCKRARISVEWTGPQQLRTTQVRPAVAIHPKTGEKVWFNHAAFWHVSSLEGGVREALLSGSSSDGLPYNTYYGDGTPIAEEVIEHIRQAYHDETVQFPWRKGDVLLVDNMLVAHGRSPFSGPRKIVVSMGNPYTRTDCQW